MKIKKFLEQVAEDDRESLVDDKDIEFLASIGVDYNKKREEDKNKPQASYYLTAPAFNYKAFLISASCFIVVAIAVFLIVFYSLKPFEPPVGYLDADGEESSNLQVLNSDLDLFTLTVDDGEYELDITRFYDKSSNNSVYYTMIFTGTMKSFNFDIVVNSEYEYKEKDYSGELKKAQISGYTLNYIETLSQVPGFPFYEISCKGEMQIGEQWIYITSYNETNLQNTLVETLQEIITFK